jgi:stage V sporulation protein D (sporulation-specific penicillin-binding protein)
MLVNCTLSQAAESLKDSSLSYRTIGQGDTVTDQLPVAGTSIAGDSQIILYLGGAEISPNTETVPELTGMSYSAARDKLSSLGLFISTRSVVDQNSSQIISSQSVAAGTAADHGCIVEVTLIDDNEALLGKY